MSRPPIVRRYPHGMADERAEPAFRSSPLFQELEQITASGDYSRFDSGAKRQHFVPRFMLAYFAEVEDGKELIYQLEVTRQEAPRRVETRLAASRRFFYGTLDDDGNRNTRVEGFLAFVESHAADALRRFLDHPGALGEADRATLSFFFALQSQRTPHGIEQIKQLGDAGTRMLLGTRLSNPATFAKDYEEVLGPAPAEDIEAQRQHMLRALEDGSVGPTEESEKAEALKNVLQIAAVLGHLIFGMDWQLIRRADAFITSERGLAIHDPAPSYPWMTQTLFSSPQAETTIPLASDACLRLRPGSGQLTIAEVGRREAEKINLRTYGWAEGYIYGRTQHLLSETRRLARHHPQDVIRRRPHHNVVVLERDPDDESLAEMHRRRGEPPYFPHEGVPHDYVLVKEGENTAKAIAFTNRKVRERAAKALGLPPGADLPGRPEMDFFGA